MKLQINDNPKTGACSVVEHFRKVVTDFKPYKDENGLMRDIHPFVRNMPCEFDENSSEDSVVLYHDDGSEIKRWDNNDALRLDIITTELIKMSMPKGTPPDINDTTEEE